MISILKSVTSGGVSEENNSRRKTIMEKMKNNASSVIDITEVTLKQLCELGFKLWLSRQ